MVPLFTARVRDLGPGDRVKITCYACGHEALLPPSTLPHGLHLPPDTRIIDLERRVRCRECNARGETLVSVIWAEQKSASDKRHP